MLDSHSTAATPSRREARTIPRDPGIDSTLALLREGYTFIPKRCRQFGSDLFETRLMLERAVCMTGPDAARQFYRPDQVTRRGGLPQVSFSLIQDNGSVMVMDGDAHRWRKAMFLSLVQPAALDRLKEATAAHWRARLRRWPGRGDVVLLDEAHVALCAAVCEWAGLLLTPRQVERRAREFAAMVDGTGSIGLRNVRGHPLRLGTERWMRTRIRQIRAGQADAPEGSAARVIAEHRDRRGELLDVRVAAVELINVLRATVANARYVAFGAMAMHEHPRCRAALRSGDPVEIECFVQEVRRFYPFISGRVLQPFDWHDHGFAQGDWVLMDLYGTNHDPRVWEAPEAFRPERFHTWDGDPYTFVPQGAGDYPDGHRCPGEWITIGQMKTMLDILAREVRYTVPLQNLAVDLGRMPALPESGFVVANVAVE
jgi:fatty-acid peroxygenase